MRIVLATDGSRDAIAASDLLQRLPLPEGSEVRILSVADDLRVFSLSDTDEKVVDEIRSSFTRSHERLLGEEAVRLEGTPWAISTELRSGYVAEEIIDGASALGAELIVVGSRGVAGLDRFFLGSVSQKVVKYAACSVLLVRPAEPDGPPRRSDGSLLLLAAVDGSPASDRAISALERLSTVRPLALRLLTVTEEGQTDEKAIEQAADRLRPRFEHLEMIVRDGNPGHEIVEEAADCGADVVVLGHKGKSAVARFFLGSVSSKVTHYAPCSVWVVR